MKNLVKALIVGMILTAGVSIAEPDWQTSNLGSKEINRQAGNLTCTLGNGGCLNGD